MGWSLMVQHGTFILTFSQNVEVVTTGPIRADLPQWPSIDIGTYYC